MKTNIYRETFDNVMAPFPCLLINLELSLRYYSSVSFGIELEA